LGECNAFNELHEVLLMRTPEQIDRIKRGHGRPYTIAGIPLSGLLDYYFDNQASVVQKTTGPRVLRVDPDEVTFAPLVSTLMRHIGDCKIRYMHFFDVTTPHIIHNDDEFEYPDCYKAFTIPLKIYGASDDVKLFVFDQYYYGGPAKFVNGEDASEFAVHYNTFLTDYSGVENCTSEQIDAQVKLEYLSHLQDDWLQGLSIADSLSWRVGNALCFDSLALHCSSDFTAKGIERKIGMSIFTTT